MSTILEPTTRTATPEISPLPQFALEELVGEGGLCRVYRARRRSDDTIVAIKVLKPEAIANDSEARHVEENGCGHLESEYRIGRQFNHPNVLTVLGLHDHSSHPHLELEFFAPLSLEDYLDPEGEQSYTDLASKLKGYAVQMASALDHLHECGWVHADVKPGNFLRNERHELKLIDFAYAKPIYRGGEFESPLQASGTDAYMSPEQRGLGPLDERSDIYSLGRTLYVLATGQLPFAERRRMTLKQLSETPLIPDARRVNPEVTAEFVELLIKMMEKDPADRLSSMSEVLNRLEGIELFHDAKP